MTNWTGEEREKWSRDRSGFSSVDLLVVLGIGLVIGIVLLIGVPQWNRTRGASQSTVALENLRELTIAWTLYASDNEGALPAAGSGIIDGIQSGFSGSNCQYLPHPVPSWAGPDAFNQGGWLGPGEARRGQIDPACSIFFSPLRTYLSGTPRFFRDPADPTTVALPGINNGKALPRVRSFSMNQWIGGPGSGSRPDIAPARKLDELPGGLRGDLVVFLGESPDSIDDGYFVIPPDQSMPGESIPAGYHNGGTGPVSFADGHGELVQWTPSSPEASSPIDPLAWKWLTEHSRVK